MLIFIEKKIILQRFKYSNFILLCYMHGLCYFEFIFSFKTSRNYPSKCPIHALTILEQGVLATYHMVSIIQTLLLTTNVKKNHAKARLTENLVDDLTGQRVYRYNKHK